MKRLIVCMHTTLDGYVAGPNGEMDWIKLDDAMFDEVGEFTHAADTALYGRVTYNMMDTYWPTAGDSPTASKHDKEHSKWYNEVDKYVISRTMLNDAAKKRTVISGNIANQITKLKQQGGKNILVFGSPSAVHTLAALDLVDEYWVFLNPVLLGEGIPLFAKNAKKVSLVRKEVKPFSCGVTGLNFEVVR
jgi:dihydrofolate reductase